MYFVIIIVFLSLYKQIVPVQFEEIDNIKTSFNLIGSGNLPSSLAADLSGCTSDELIIFDPPEPNLSTFQAQFPISSPTNLSGWPSTTNMRKSDSSRGNILLSCSLSILSIN